MPFSLADLAPGDAAAVAFGVGVGVGTLLTIWVRWLTPEVEEERRLAGAPRPRGGVLPHVPLVGSLIDWRRGAHGGERLLIELGTGLLFAAYVFLYRQYACQTTPSVQPTDFWFLGRIVYHLILIALLVAATATDLRDYTIPDAITLTGVVIGLLGATFAGELQITHLWIDWNDQFAEHFGPYIPQWIKDHQHWHGFAWSLAGLIVGAGMTWLVRFLSRVILGRESLGFGDVTLMAMIGAFIGWQPVVCAFFLAPACAIVVGLLVRIVTGRTFIPYGPYLGLAAYLVLCIWRWLWMSELLGTRYLFGHVPSLASIAGFSIGALVVLLALLRVYHAIPVEQRLSLPAESLAALGLTGDELGAYQLPNTDWRCPYSGHRDGP